MRAGDSRPDKEPPPPLYRRLAERLREEIAQRSPDDRIDSETGLAKRFAVSRFTVMRAIDVLVDDGLLVRRQGRGTFIAGPAARGTPSSLLSFTQAALAVGRVASNKLLGFGPAAWRPGLPYARDEALIELDRLRLVDDMPIAIHRSVIPARVATAAGLTPKTVAEAGFSLYRRFFEAGLQVVWGAEALRARGASIDEADLLGLDGDRVVMAVQRHTYGGDSAVLEAVDAVYDARRYAYGTEIRRSAPLDPGTSLVLEPGEGGDGAKSGWRGGQAFDGLDAANGDGKPARASPREPPASR